MGLLNFPGVASPPGPNYGPVSINYGHPMAQGLTGLWMFNGSARAPNSSNVRVVNEVFGNPPESSGQPFGWTHNSHGPAIALGAANQGLHNLCGASSYLRPAMISTDRVTMLVIKRRVATLSTGTEFGTTFAAPASDFCRALCPATTGGEIIFDFGGISGDNRLTTASQSWNNTVDVMGFVAGTRGLAIYRNGVKIASSTAAVTRTNGGTFSMIGSADGEEYNFLAILNAEWLPTQMLEWMANPYAMLLRRPMASRTIFVAARPDGPKIIIGGIDVTDKIRTGDGFEFPTFTWRRNQRALLTFDIELYPAKRAEVIWFNKTGTVPIIGGFIDRREPVDVPLGADFCTRCEVVDFSQCYDWCYWTKNYTTDKTRKEVLIDFIAEKLGPNYSITLDPAQADGPTYTAPFGWTDAKGSEVMKFLVGSTAIDRITPGKVLKVFEVGSEAAPVSIYDTNYSRLTWADSTQTPANTVIGKFGPPGNTQVTQQWTQAGAATSWTADIVGLEFAHPWALVVYAGGIGGSPTFYDVGPGLDYEWAVGPPTVLTLGTAPLPSDGDVIEAIYGALFPFEVRKTTGATPVIETLINRPDIAHFAQADAEMDAVLLQMDQDDARIFDLDTLEDGLFPGQLLPIDVPERDAASTEAIITAVRGVANDDLFWEYNVQAEEAAFLQVDPIADLRQQLALT